MSLRRQFRSAIARLSVTVLALGVFAGLAWANNEHSHAGHSHGSSVKDEMITWIQDAESKLIELAEATPENKYSYRPGKGVRSTGEVFMHVAAANYGIPSFIGVTPPAGFDFATYEKSKTKKAEIVAALRASFEHMGTVLKGMSEEDMEKPAEFFGMKTTARGAYLLLLSHCHEHLGQSIAYARGSGIVPPWTARMEEAAAAAKKGEKAAGGKGTN